MEFEHYKRQELKCKRKKNESLQEYFLTQSIVFLVVVFFADHSGSSHCTSTASILYKRKNLPRYLLYYPPHGYSIVCVFVCRVLSLEKDMKKKREGKRDVQQGDCVEQCVQ